MNNNNFKEENFSGLEIRNKPNVNNQQTNNPIKTNKGFVFIKGRVNQDEQISSSNKDLLNIKGHSDLNNTSKDSNNFVKSPKTENINKQGFSFFKSAKTSSNISQPKYELSSVFNELNN